jgi:hypothetical protein
MHGGMRNVHKIVVGRTEGKRPLGTITQDGKIILEWILEK